MLNEYPALGAVLCCGKAPLYGKHNFHEYPKGVFGPGDGFYCPECKKSAAYLDNKENKAFALNCWNRKIDRSKQILNAPDGFKFGVLSLKYEWMGGKNEQEFHAVLFKNDSLKDYSWEDDYKKEGIQTVEILNPVNGLSHTVSFRKRYVGYIRLFHSIWFNPTIEVNRLEIIVRPSAYKELEALGKIGYIMKENY